MKVVVVGAGVVGLSSAVLLAERGHDVLVLDRRRAGHADGASYVNAGMLVPSHLVPIVGPGVPRQVAASFVRPASPLRLAVPRERAGVAWLARALRSSTRGHVERATPVLCGLLVESLRLLRERLAEAGADDIVQGEGLLMIARTRGGLERERPVAEAARANGLQADVLDPDALRALEPDVASGLAGAVHFPGDAWLDAAELMAHLVQRAGASGVQLAWGREARRIALQGSRARGVQTADGFEPADAVVVAAGAASSRLLHDVGVALPLLPGRGCGMTLEAPAEGRPRHCVLIVEEHVAVSPLRGGVRVSSGMHLGASRERVDAGLVGRMQEAVARTFPALRPTGVRVPARAGLRPCSPDGLPYIGRVAALDGVSVASGHGMLGVSLSAVSAVLVAAAVEGRTPPVDLDLDLELVRPDRFARRDQRRGSTMTANVAAPSAAPVTAASTPSGAASSATSAPPTASTAATAAASRQSSPTTKSHQKRANPRT